MAHSSAANQGSAMVDPFNPPMATCIGSLGRLAELMGGKD
jgi:hypothetical protein